MTVLYATGFETGTFAMEDVIETTNCGINTTPVSGYWSNYSLFVNGTAGGWRVVVPSALECRIFFHWQSQGANQKVLAICTADASIQAKITTNGSAKLQTWRGDEAALLDTGDTVCASGQWFPIEIRFKADDSAGIFQVWVDTILDIDRTTGDTKAHASDANVGQLRLGGSGYYDDVVFQDTGGSLNNTRIFVAKIHGVVADGAGSSTQFSRGGTDSGANWSQTDERPANDATDYVQDTVAGHKDLYNFQDISQFDAIAAAVQRGKMQKDDAGVANARFLCKSSSTTDNGPDFAMPTSWAYKRRIYETDPATSSLWTPSGFNAAEFGLEVRT